MSAKNIILTFIVVAIIAGLMIVNNMISGKIDDDIQQVAPKAVVIEKPKVMAKGEITRQSILEPNRQYYENVYYANGEEIARNKSDGKKVFDIVGTIPDGPVKFKDFTEKTHGTEYYKNGKRHGELVEYYNEGPLKGQATYAAGKVQTSKDYFFDGTLRMELDLRDGMPFSDSMDKGSGKMYHRNGKLMYEWHLTNSDENRYTKAYDVEGNLTQLEIYDAFGKLLERTDYRKQHQAAGQDY